VHGRYIKPTLPYMAMPMHSTYHKVILGYSLNGDFLVMRTTFVQTIHVNSSIN